MPLWKNTQHAFVAGQLDSHVMGRQDLDKYARGATLLKNFLVKRQGCISKRRGTDLAADLSGLLGLRHDGTPIVPDAMRLIPVVNGDDGRYLILSNGVCFVADRDGVVATDGVTRMRRIAPYEAEDEDGRPIIIGGADTRADPDTPIDLIHRISAGNYTVTRHASLQDAFNAAADGDTVRLHSNLLLTSPVTVKASSSWQADGASATVDWNVDTTNHVRQYRIVTGGATYWSRETDYYGNRATLTFNRRFVTATRNWSFSDGNAWSASWSGNIWTFTRSSGGGAITATGRGALDATSISFTDGGNAVTASCTWSFSGTDYDPSMTYTMTVEGYYWRMKATDGSTTWSGLVYVPQYSATVDVVSTIGTATQDEKAVTLDLYGYKITVNSSACGIIVKSAAVTLVVDSARVGGKFVLMGTGGTRNIFYLNSSTDRVPSGRLVLKGEIEYGLYSSGSGYHVVSAADTLGVQIDAGTFTNYGTHTAFVLIDGGSLVVNDGEFTNELDGSFYVYTFRSVAGSNRSLDTSITINGGAFKNMNSSFNSSSPEYSGYVICNVGGTVAVNGGRFMVASARNLVYSTDYRGHTWWNLGFFRIARGEFSVDAIGCNRDGWRAHDLADYLADGSILNSEQPNADGFYGVKVEGEADYSFTHRGFDRRPYRIAVPYADEDLHDLCVRQSGDTLFIAHRSYPPAKIVVDRDGRAEFEELKFDNTEVLPPNIKSIAMAGNGPKATEWPWARNFDSDFKADIQALGGTVTDAGMNSNSTSGTDGSTQTATTYQATVEKRDRTEGRKTVTTLVKSVTNGVSVETQHIYINGNEIGEWKKDVVTGGTAQNSAAATSNLTTRTVRYCATYVKDGRESRPSPVRTVTYDMPWANNAVVNLSVDKGANGDEADYYNVYKDNGNGFGLIGTVSCETAMGGVEGFLDSYPLWMPDTKAASAALACAADIADARGWANGDLLRKLVSSTKDEFGASVANDICLISTAANAAKGIYIDFSATGGLQFRRIRAFLDGRIYDRASDASYVIVSSPTVTATVTYSKTGGGTGTFSAQASAPQSHSWGGITGGWMQGIYEDWVGLQRRAFTAPNGDTVYGWLYGKGDCRDDFNSHLRTIDFSFTLPADFKSARSVRFTFSTSAYSYWTNNQQGCLHSIHFYDTGTSADGSFQDDYINPDMTVTPPDGTKDPHFSAAGDYPGSVGIYTQRLVFASSENYPSTIWMSRIADLYNFTAHESIREDDALELTLAATEFPKLNHLIAGRDLMLFGDGGEWLVAPVQGNSLTYKTASAKLQSMIGSERSLQPLQLADETLFAERGGTCLRAINYNYASDSYQTRDLSVIAQSIFRANPIVSMAYKQHPDSIVECVLKDGRVATLVYMPEQEVMAWSVQELGGGWKAREIATPKCIVEGTTEMMLLVERDGAWQLWKVRNDSDELTAASQVILDGMHIEASPAATGAGEHGIDLGDGTCAVGYPVESEFVSVRPEPERGPTAQMELKNATEAEIRVIDASTFSVKPYDIQSGWRAVPLPLSRSGTSVKLAERDCKRLMTGANGRDGRIHLKHTEPWPLTILSISTTYQVEYENGDGEGGGR